MKYALVPLEDIEKLEAARVRLFDVHYEGNLCIKDMITHEISEPMWQIAHKKYTQVEIDE